jgi:predicted enzyme related to lactoylglutathione lyase
MSGRVVYFEIPFDESSRARAFYHDVFGWYAQTAAGEADYTVVTTGPSGDDGPVEAGFINGGLTARADLLRRPAITIDVEDIDGALADVEKHGGHMVGTKSPVGDLGYAAYFTDTEGNLMGLWQNAA